jgi:hypothetical protein
MSPKMTKASMITASGGLKRSLSSRSNLNHLGSEVKEDETQSRNVKSRKLLLLDPAVSAVCSNGQECATCKNCETRFYAEKGQMDDKQSLFCSGDCLWSWRLSRIHVDDKGETPWVN